MLLWLVVFVGQKIYIELLVELLGEVMFSSYMSYVEQLLICADWSICETSCLV